MSEVKPQRVTKRKKLSFFELIVETLGWLQIVASPLLVAAAIGFGIYIAMDNDVGLIIAILISLTGLIIGIIWATKVSKKSGAMNYISRVMSSPDFDKLDKKEDNEKEKIL